MERDIKPTYDELESYIDRLDRQLADAQATIAALQDERDGWVRSREHYYQLWMRATDERDEMRKERDEFESLLTQRTAELEAVKREAAEQGRYAVEMFDELKRVQAELERVRGLVKTYADAKIDFDDKRLQEDHHAWKERYNKLVEAENALLQHRQGMEG